MNKKTVIQIVVVVCAFSGSGIVLYKGFFRNSRPPNVISLTAGPGGSGAGLRPAQAAAGKSIDKILPNGASLDLDVLKRPRVEYGLRPEKNTVSEPEIGISQFELVVPLKDTGGQ